MKFTKMHGIGNDYVYVNAFEETVKDKAAAARFVSDRHFGIGSDGLIFICPSEIADCRMEMYNLDGSLGSMCGNGVRCVAKYAFDHGISRNNPMRVETGAGIKTIQMEIEEGKMKSACVDMGEPEVTTLAAMGEKAQDSSQKEVVSNLASLSLLPFQEEIQVGGKTYTMIPISVGNPHAIVFWEDVDSLDIETIGPLFENHPRFPDRTNTEFVEVLDRKNVKMRVWERGSGETLACGTGATATGVACMLAGVSDREVTVHLLGGDLAIRWDDETGHVFMTGTATEVFRGEIDLPEGMA